MSVARQVFLLSPSLEDERPEIRFELKENQRADWLSIDEVLRGERPLTDYREPEVVVLDAGAELWDFYLVPGTLGLLSARAVDVLAPFADKHFDVLPARISGSPYFFPRTKAALDCLDHERSSLDWFDDERTRVMRIRRFRFHKDRIEDPLVFNIPEDEFSLFATQSVRAAIRRAGLNGFRVLDVEQVED